VDSGSKTEDIGIIFGHPDRPLLYSSGAITERRRRILREAQRLIAERGIDGFNIRELCRRADVAQRTLYNAFENKDRIVALAIWGTYTEVNQRMRYRTAPETLEGILDRLISVNSRNLRARNYTKAVTSLYFSPTTSADVLHTLREMASLDLRLWLTRVEAEGDLAPWVRRGELEINFVNLEYATINDWACGRIEDEDYVQRLVEAVLLLTVGATVGSTREEAAKALQTIRRENKLPEFPKPVFVPLPSSVGTTDAPA
jgi:AcrR family transcriptional regulator